MLPDAHADVLREAVKAVAAETMEKSYAQMFTPPWSRALIVSLFVAAAFTVVASLPSAATAATLVRCGQLWTLAPDGTAPAVGIESASAFATIERS